MRALGTTVALGLVMASTAWAQGIQTVVVSAGDSLIITTTTTTIVRVVGAPPGDTPPDAILPVLRVVDITAPAVVSGSDLDALVAGTIAIFYDAQVGGLFSRDHNGFGDGGHTTLHLQDGELEVRSQSTSASFRMRGGPAAGIHRAVYRWGPEGMSLFLDGSEAATNDHDGSMAGNFADMVIGASCVQCVPGTTAPLLDQLEGQIFSLEIYDSRMSDTEAAAWSSVPGASLPTSARGIMAALDSIDVFPSHVDFVCPADLLCGLTIPLLPLVFAAGQTYAALTDSFLRVWIRDSGVCQLPGDPILAVNGGTPANYPIDRC